MSQKNISITWIPLSLSCLGQKEKSKCRIYTHTHTHIYTHKHIYMHACVYMYTYMSYVYWIYIHGYIYICMRRSHLMHKGIKCKFYFNYQINCNHKHGHCDLKHRDQGRQNSCEHGHAEEPVQKAEAVGPAQGLRMGPCLFPPRLFRCSFCVKPLQIVPT